MTFHVGAPNLGDRQALHARLDELLDRRWLTNSGPLVEAFEQRVAEFLRVKHAVAVSSATSGLEILVRALDLTGEVIVPAFTFVATAHVLRWLGLTPVFADIRTRDLTLDPAAAEAAITPRTSGILAVHTFGRPAAVHALAGVAARHGLALLFDAAPAFGVSTGLTYLGGFGEAEVFSFHATKVVTCGEGGVVTTNSDSLATRLRQMRNFGFVGYDQVAGVGINAKLNEFAAALGLTSLEALDQFVAVNRGHYQHYWQRLAGLPGCTLLPYPLGERQTFAYITCLVHAGRDALLAHLHAQGVLARRYFYPGVHRLEPYCEQPVHLPVTEWACAESLCLPTGTALRPVDVARICTLVEEFLADAH